MSQIKENAAGQSRFPLNEAEKEWLHKEEEKAGKNLEEYPKAKAYGMCFACGEDNPVGLHLHFFLEDRDAAIHRVCEGEQTADDGNCCKQVRDVERLIQVPVPAIDFERGVDGLHASAIRVPG